MKRLRRLLLGVTALCIAFSFSCCSLDFLQPGNESSNASESQESTNDESSEALDSEDDSVEDSEDDSVEDSEEDSVEDSEEDSVEDSEEDSVEDSEEDSIEDSEEDSTADSEEDSTDDSGDSSGDEVHTHAMTKQDAVEATCTTDGNIEYYTCDDCGKIYADEDATTELTMADVVIEASHALTKVDATNATCTADGNIEYYTCGGTCGKIYADEDATTELAMADVVIAASHALTKVDATNATCTTDGNIEYYTCGGTCGKIYADENATTELTMADVVIAASHSLVYYEAKEPSGKTNGNVAYYDCSDCDKYFTDAAGVTEIAEGDIVIVAAMNIPDFLVEVESGKEPVVLQLSDPQLCNWGDPETYAYQYMREAVEETNPDLIIITGDLVYGRFDPDGSLLKSLIAFMESLETPWAPVFGNHDNESLMGVDWQCAQLEAAEYCLFKQGDVTGNGNYSVGIAQNNELLRVFYMMDSNGCGSPMCDENGAQTQPAAGTNVVKTSAGFANDQIKWYTDEINAIHKADANVKISFAYHIQQAIFEKAFRKYSEYDGASTNSVLNNPLNFDILATADDTDFGYLGRAMKSAWDSNYSIFNGMKALGVDSIFVGHEHCNSASIVFEGVRFQYSQKSSRYDRYNTITEDGTITGAYDGGHPNGAHLLMGGTVIPVSAVDGTITTGYIYYAGNPFYFEPKPEPLPVDGEVLTDENLQYYDQMTLETKPFDENFNAYYITSEINSGKIYLDIPKAAANNYLTFSIYLEDSGDNSASTCFAFRVKPDPSAVESPQASYDGSKYIWFKLLKGEWLNVTVDISKINADCTEFAFMTMTGLKVWIKDIAYHTEKPGEIIVNGLAIDASMFLEGKAMTAEAKAFDENTNAYYITAMDNSSKIFLDPALAIANNYFTFSVFVPVDSTRPLGDEMYLRVKPDGTMTEAQGCTDTKHINFSSTTSDPLKKLTRGAWTTFTVDISGVGSDCTEFAFMFHADTKLWIKDIAFTMEKPGNDREISVNGIQLSTSDLQLPNQMTLEAKAFDDTVDAYYVTNTVDSGRIYLDTAQAAANNYFTFKVFVPMETEGEAKSQLALRVKPNGTLTPEQGSTDGNYAWFNMARGQWVTITVDITNIGSNCTEFSLVMMNGTRLWLRDIAFTMEAPVEEDNGKVNGLQLSIDDLQDPSKVTLEAKAFDENTMAYYITSQVNSSKVYMDTATAAASTTFTFSACLAEDTETNSFGLRVKPDGTPFSSEQGVLSADGKYIWFELKKGEWTTVTVDISQVGTNCTEFAFTTMAGLKIWVKDISFS